MSTISLNKRFVLEQTGSADGYDYRLVDLYRSETVGSFWKTGDVWSFQLGDDWRNGSFGSDRDAMIRHMRRRLPVTLRRPA